MKKSLSRRCALPLLFVLVGSGACDDQLPVVDDATGSGDICALGLCGQPDVPEVQEEDTSPPPEVVDDDQCKLDWSYTRPEGGVPSHPVVSDDSVATIVAGDTLRRLEPDGSDAAACAAPLTLTGEQLGTPSQSPQGRFWIGTASGKIVRVNRKCELVGALTDIEEACAKATTGCNQEFILDGVSHPVRQAPAHGAGNVYVLDEQPVLHEFSTNGDHTGAFISVDEHARWAAPVYVPESGGTGAFVAFPTKHTVVAVRAPSPTKLWVWKDFLDPSDAEREITTPLAVTAGGKLLFVGAEPAGGTHKNHALYRLLPEGDGAKGAVVDAGFPRALSFPLDTIHALVIGPDESIYAATRSHGVARFDADGVEQWRFIGDEESLRVTTVPALGDDGALYFTAEPHFVYGVNANGARIFRYETTGELESTSPAIRADGRVIVHFGTELMAWDCPTTGLANSSWPRYQRNNRNSGNLAELK